jgi:hypothetical protein
VSRSHASLSGARLAAGLGLALLAALSVTAFLASVFVGVARSADPPLSPPTGPHLGNIRCTGIVVNVSVDNVVVPRGALCLLERVEVRGSVLAKPAALIITLNPGTLVRGDVEVKEGSALVVSGAKVGGNVKCDGCLPRTMSGSDVGGSFQITDALTGVFMRSTDVGGDLEITGTVGGFPTSVEQSFVHGSVKLEKNTTRLSVVETTVGGNLAYLENSGGGDLIFNRVGGNMQVFKNRSAAPMQIIANIAAQSLQCRENEPPPFALFNGANLLEGQCGPPGS